MIEESDIIHIVSGLDSIVKFCLEIRTVKNDEQKQEEETKEIISGKVKQTGGGFFGFFGKKSSPIVVDTSKIIK